MAKSFDPAMDRVIRYLHDHYDMENKIRYLRIINGITALERT